MSFQRNELSFKVISLLYAQWVRSYGEYNALEFYKVKDLLSLTYNQLDKTQLEKIMKLCIEAVDPEYKQFDSYAILETINREKNASDEIAHHIKNADQSRAQLLLDKGKFTSEMYYLTRSERCKDPEYILTMFCNKPAKRIQKAWQRYQRNKSAKRIQHVALKWLYKPGGIMMKKAETRFYKLAKKQNRLSLDFPDFTVSFFNNMPIENFNSSLKLVNRDWYKECKRELEERRKLSYKKFSQSFHNMMEVEVRIQEWWMPDPWNIKSEDHPEYNKYIQLEVITNDDCKALKQVNEAILRCGFPADNSSDSDLES